MAIYTVFESTNMGSTKYAERIFDAVATTEVENGTFGYLNGLADGESNIYKFVAGTKEGETVVVVDNPAWDADTCRITNQRKDKYINQSGVPFRVRVIKKNDEFGITEEGITSASKQYLKEKAFLTIDSTGKLVASESTTPSAIMEAVVERKRISGGTLVTTAHNYGHSRTIYEARVKTLA